MVNGLKPQGPRRSLGVKLHTPILWRTSARFPLTPALSLGEREICIPSRDASEHFRCATARTMVLPRRMSRITNLD